MKSKTFNICDYISADQIRHKVSEIGSKPLTVTGHGYKTYGPIPILQSASQSTSNYTKRSIIKPAIGLIDVVLAANRNYNKVVEPHIIRIEKEAPSLCNFTDLRSLISKMTKTDFFIFWGHRDEKKYKTLIGILSSIEKLKAQNPQIHDDFQIMNFWAGNADLLNYKQDIIGSLPNVAIATFQHLRMVFGADTIKPDQRVKEVLDYEFELPRLSDVNAIKAVEQIASIVKMQVIKVDQIFVQYGSSYYNQSANKLSIKQVISNLKELGVSNEVLSQAAKLTIGQIEKIK